MPTYLYLCQPIINSKNHIVMKKILAVAVLALALSGAMAQTVVNKYAYTDGQPAGMLYSLPRAEVVVTLTVERTESRPGPFYMYAERFLALTDVVTEPSVSWSLRKAAISSVAVPDADRTFVVLPDKKGVADRMTLTPDGIIRAVNASPADEPTAAGQPAKKRKKQKSLDFDMSVLGEEALTATSMPKMAELAAKHIYRIRESRAAILAGETESFPDGKALEAILRRWEKEERALIALFAGKTVTTTATETYRVSPRGDMKNNVIARISEVEGLVAADDVIGLPVYLDIKGVYPPVPVAPEKKAKPLLGFAYCVPGSASVVVRDANATLAQTTVPMPQFGYVNRLPQSLTDKDGAALVFSPATGAVISFSAADK